MANIKGRYQAVDALRGLIMVLMAIDHASAFIARQHSSEFWAGAMTRYTSTFAFWTRWVTHLCAPGFFFLMGAGIYWFAASRQQAGWSAGRVARRTTLRGLAIFLVGQVLEGPVLFLQGQLKPAAAVLSRTSAPPPIDGTALYWGFITLSGLGLVMIACALLLRLPRWTWIATVAGCVFATNSLLPASGKPGPVWETILLAPGLSHHLMVVYPVLPWLAVSATGMYFGYWWRANPQVAEKRFWMIGVAMLVVAVVLRAAGGWGNIRLPRDGSWIEFLNNVKYPPSLVFWTMSVGIDLLLLWVLMRLPKKLLGERSPLIVFGQTPLFFYLAHFYLLFVFALALFHEAGSLEMAYVMWVVALLVMYPVCLAYRGFKAGKPTESFWRLF
ncbi:MAG TPA: heparan-alpha-glucosaminide N-acetyltransferase domain-containing protein [Bryobacteraceae bacterium]|nr:heparan-alpha-glucosaminide N-acetyltransferase domain-containing protein [Bryobacteraceae bacterium]